MRRNVLTPFMLCMVLGVVWLSAEGLGDIKRRMTQRAPRIGHLKKDKAVGENNRGYLEILKAGSLDAKAKQLVRDENGDRRLVYEAIAKAEGTTADLVGRNRAMMIAKRAEPGIMVQQPDGTWKETG